MTGPGSYYESRVASGKSVWLRLLALQQNRRLQLLRKMLPVKLLVHIQLAYFQISPSDTKRKPDNRYWGWQNWFKRHQKPALPKTFFPGELLEAHKCFWMLNSLKKVTRSTLLTSPENSLLQEQGFWQRWNWWIFLPILPKAASLPQLW